MLSISKIGIPWLIYHNLGYYSLRHNGSQTKYEYSDNCITKIFSIIRDRLFRKIFDTNFQATFKGNVQVKGSL